MGQVFRARDTNLNRDVALKILPDSFAADADRVARFQREAQALASLNHQNIAQIYGIESNAIVMELVEGDDLSVVIARNAALGNQDSRRAPGLALSDALPIAKQIADALEAAHEQGIVHRDLKPANIRVRADGTVKVLDFGLAKDLSPTAAGATADAMNSPTMTAARATGMGMILGTAAYMAPEQAKGKSVDKRADIWAFGVVLHEMLTGRRLFDAEDASEILAAVLTREVSLTSLPSAVPPRLRALLRDCLIRDPKQRLRDIGDARIAIDEIMAGAPNDLPAPALVNAAIVPSWRRAMPWAAVLIVAVVGSIGWWRAMRPAAQPESLLRLNVEVSPDMPLAHTTTVAISPDGTRLVLRAETGTAPARLYTRLLRENQLTALAGTDGAVAPFFSPDGEWIGFVAEGKLRKVSVNGGAPLTLCDSASAAQGASWGDDGNIVFVGGSRRLMRVSSAGGVPALLTQLPDGPRTPRGPQVLPGSDVVLYTARTGNTLRDDDIVEAFDIKNHRTVAVQRGAFSARYVATPSGSSLIYLHRSTLFAAPFDVARLTVTGTGVPVVEGIFASLSGEGEYTVSRTGTLVYLSGGAEQGTRTVAWVDRSGHVEPLSVPRGPYFSPRLSPDGKRLAMSMDLDSQTAIVVKEQDGDSLSRLTLSDGVNEYPVWTPDGQYVVFHSTRASGPGLYRVRSDGTGEAQRISDDPSIGHPYSISADGKYLALTARGVEGKSDVVILAIQGDATHQTVGKPQPFTATPFGESFPSFSPDGRWLAYVSNESGAVEVYVRAFPGPGRAWQISIGGGGAPTWSRSGSDVLYRAKDGRVMVVNYTANVASFSPGKPQVWTAAQVGGFASVYGWDLAADGKRLVALQSNTEDVKPVTHLMFLVHFGDELQRLFAGGAKR
jgi:Tol biopolymer transport system component